MPYKIEKITLPKELDRRVKLTEQQRDEIKTNINGLSINKLSQEYKVSRRLIQFILYPERLEVCRNAFAKRRKDGRYYDKEKHKEAIKNTRRYKHGIGYEKLLSMKE